MKSSSELLLNWGSKVMKSDEGFLNNVDKQMLNQLVNENVIRFPNQNTLKTEIKQNYNPRNESFGGFLLLYFFIDNFFPIIMLI